MVNSHHNQAVCTISEIWPRFGARSTPGDQRQLSVESWLTIHKQLWIIGVLGSTNTFYENMSSCPILWKNCNGTRDHPPLGKGHATKSDEFPGKFQTAFELPLLLEKIYCKFCFYSFDAIVKQDHRRWRYHRRLLDYQSPYFQLIIE